ncbi:nuclear transport factor 2 family protein [Gordonia rubripertincta]|uniref:Nuclear transport factor 2 family protein n=1 Tax=Gordonia rubripertincta TaxID=36822 RepID=A0ABT4MQS5_GORRU|nr:nuclear transport factor 2 family protein [Gordonia rubripertincta]MCZ4549357.1 nuclear transport factor 2 family protein [Gordonia rubripertincta]
MPDAIPAPLDVIPVSTDPTDALIRFAFGLDAGDKEILESAFTEDVVFDVSQVGDERSGFPAIEGRDSVVGMLLMSMGPLDTMHALSNFRVHVGGDVARLNCYAMAQHYRPGEGRPRDKTDQVMMGNKYDAELVRDGAGWRIRRLTIVTVWSQGNPDVLIDHLR